MVKVKVKKEKMMRLFGVRDGQNAIMTVFDPGVKFPEWGQVAPEYACRQIYNCDIRSFRKCLDRNKCIKEGSKKI